jgi:mono/diheme cytochrome c family protein
VKAWAWLAVLLLACGCEKIARNMYDGAKERPLQGRLQVAPGEAAVVTGPSASQRAAEGAVARASGIVAGTSSGRAGVEEERRRTEAESATSIPYPVSLQLLKRGQERFEIYCVPCHSPVGDGDGFVTRRGFPHPPSYHIARLRQAPDRHFYDVMTDGYGIMYSYGDRVTPEDRWAIVAYIRALQRSQGATVVAGGGRR